MPWKFTTIASTAAAAVIASITAVGAQGLGTGDRAIGPLQVEESGDRVEKRSEDVAPNAATGPQMPIYFVSGVTDSGDAHSAGTATTFFCTNKSATSERLIFRVRNYQGVEMANYAATLSPQRTYTASTHGTLAFVDDIYLSPGRTIAQGHAVIWSTSKNVFCSAMVVDAASTEPSGVALHMVRQNAQPGTQE